MRYFNTTFINQTVNNPTNSYRWVIQIRSSQIGFIRGIKLRWNSQRFGGKLRDFNQLDLCHDEQHQARQAQQHSQPSKQDYQALERQNRALLKELEIRKKEIEFLKKASAYFASLK